jgi:hypothetical protein
MEEKRENNGQTGKPAIHVAPFIPARRRSGSL